MKDSITIEEYLQIYIQPILESKCIEQLLVDLNKETNSSTLRVGENSIPLSDQSIPPADPKVSMKQTKTIP